MNFRGLGRAAIAVTVFALALPGPASAQIPGKTHDHYWDAAGGAIYEYIGPTCGLHYMSEVYPGTSERTVKLNADFRCDELGIYSIHTIVRALDQNGEEHFAAARICTSTWGPTQTECAQPNDPFTIAETVRVPNGTYIGWYIEQVHLTLPEAGATIDPWVKAPFEKGCTVGTAISRCELPFVANDPERFPFNEIE